MKTLTVQYGMLIGAAIMCLAIGAAFGVVLVDDHPNTQKLTLAATRAQLQEDIKAMQPMVPACMKFLGTIESTHAMAAVPKGD